VKRLIALIVTSVFGLGLGVALLSSPAVAVGHPGNTCNPAPGHGRSGCHRVTTSSGSGTKTTSKTASQKRAAATPVVAAKKKAATRLAAVATAATAPSVMGTAPASLVPLHPAAPRLPWWLQIWHFLFG